MPELRPGSGADHHRRAVHTAHGRNGAATGQDDLGDTHRTGTPPSNTPGGAQAREVINRVWG